MEISGCVGSRGFGGSWQRMGPSRFRGWRYHLPIACGEKATSPRGEEPHRGAAREPIRRGYRGSGRPMTNALCKFTRPCRKYAHFGKITGCPIGTTHHQRRTPFPMKSFPLQSIALICLLLFSGCSNAPEKPFSVASTVTELPELHQENIREGLRRIFGSPSRPRMVLPNSAADSDADSVGTEKEMSGRSAVHLVDDGPRPFGFLIRRRRSQSRGRDKALIGGNVRLSAQIVFGDLLG
jgi:hypothetical protein